LTNNHRFQKYNINERINQNPTIFYYETHWYFDGFETIFTNSSLISNVKKSKLLVINKIKCLHNITTKLVQIKGYFLDEKDFQKGYNAGSSHFSIKSFPNAISIWIILMQFAKNSLIINTLICWSKWHLVEELDMTLKIFWLKLKYGIFRHLVWLDFSRTMILQICNLLSTILYTHS
jgi:hypothetical protein